MQHIKSIDETALSDESVTLDGQQNTASGAVETKSPENQSAGVTAASSGVTTFSTSSGSECNMRGDRQITNSLNRAGTGSYDLYSQNVKFVHHDMTVGHPSLPIEIYHVYNLEHVNNIAAYCKTYCGNGWRTSYHQYIGSFGTDAQGKQLYFYIDASGERYAIIWKDGRFVLAKDENTIYNPVAKTLTSQQYVLNFDTSGWLSAQADRYGNVITIVNSEGKILSIKTSNSEDRQNLEISFDYTHTNYLSRITHTTPGTGEIVYNLNFDYMSYTTLYSISYAAGSSNTTEFRYISSGKLSKIFDPIDHKLEYEYGGINGEVSKIVETAGDSISDGTVTAEPVRTREWKIDSYYSNSKYVRIKVTRKGITTVYVFDGRKCKFAYTDKSTSGMDGLNRLAAGAELAVSQNGVTMSKGKDYAASLDFTSLSSWIKTGTVSQSYDFYAAGYRSLMLTGNANGFVRAERSYFGFTPGKSYAISCFALNARSGSASGNTSFCFMAELINSLGIVVDRDVYHFDKDEAYWQAGAVRLKGDGNRIRVTVIFDYLGGHAYFDGLRIVEAAYQKITPKDGEDGSKIITIVDNDGSTKVTEIDASGLVKKQTDGNYSCTYEYDDDKRVKKMTDNNGLVTEYEYNGYAGRQSLVKRSLGSQFIQSKYNSVQGLNGDKNWLVETDPASGAYVHTDLRTGKVSKSAYNGQTTKYSYLQSGGNLTKIEQTPLNYRNEYYYTRFLLTKVVSDNNIIKYTYDGFGQLKEVKLNDVLVKTYAYKDDYNYSTTDEGEYNFEQQTISAGDGGSYSQKTIYNADGMPVCKKESTNGGSETELVRILYDADGIPTGVNDYAVNASKPLTQTFLYNSDGSISKTTYSGIRTGSIEQNRESDTRITKNITFLNDTAKYDCDHNKKGQLSWIGVIPVSPNQNFLTTVLSDSLNRPNCKSTQLQQSNKYYSDYYEYEEKTSQETTDRLKSIRYGYLGNVFCSTKYTYNLDGNIDTETNILGGLQKYTYDGAGRLYREDNEKLGFSKLYMYNAGAQGGGNISKVIKAGYNPTATASALIGLGTEYIYGYDGNTDRLTGAYGKTISNYDSAGNPCRYKGNVLKWERGRRLKSYDIVTYEYDAAGIRQGKQTRTTTHTYYTEGTRIHRETRAHYANNYNLWYYYDQTGICAFECNGTMYHMKKNLQGDIVMLLDVDGNVAAKYVYDAWGNHKVYNPNNTENTTSTFIGNINPFRYRGYYYDADTNLYYLNSRYYDPEIGRFINADSIDFAEPESLSGLNLYAYCGNNPVNMIDPSGRIAISLALILIGVAIGGAFGAGSSIISQGIEYGWDKINWGQVAFDGIMGGIMGGLSMSSLGSGWLMGAGGFTSLLSYMADCYAHRDVKEPTWQGILLATGLGMFFGGMGGNGYQYPTKELVKGTLRLTAKQAALISIKSAGVSGGARIIQTGISNLMNWLTDGEWSRLTGLNTEIGIYI